jgi:S-adenosylmethionine hydrolase
MSSNSCNLSWRSKRGARDFVIVLAFALMTTLCSASDARLVFMTDFGIIDDSVAICKGVMYSIDPDLRIVDLTHQVTPYSILDGARYLFGATPYFPAGTVFVVVIDPTVGSARKAIVVKSKRGQYFVIPDNGLITLVADRDGIDGAREITNRNWMIGAALSSTFHGRDIFSPVGAHLARGDDWNEVGPELSTGSLVRLDWKSAHADEAGIHGTVIATDGPFGNLVTNIDADDFLKLGFQHGDEVHIKIGAAAMVVPFVRTFSDVAVAKPLLYIDSRGHLALAVNQRSFAAIYHVKPPESLNVTRPGK